MSSKSYHKTQLHDRKYLNWVKGGLALKYLKDGIGDFVAEVVKEEHDRILHTLGLSPGSTCNLCILKMIKPPHAPAPNVKQCPIGQRHCNCLLSNTNSCPSNICDRIYDEIVKSHRTLQPFWKNTDIKKWTSHPWEIAKCFINVPGHDRKQSAEDTDVAGLLHLFINCTFFQGRVSYSVNLFDTIREWMNSVFHSPSMELEDPQLKDGINDIITLLEDDKELKSKKCSRQAVLNLKRLQQGNLILTTETEAEVCRAALASITLATNELKHIQDEARKDIELKREEAKKYFDLKQEETLKNVNETAESGSTKLQVELSELRKRVDNHDLEKIDLQTRDRDIEIDIAKLKKAQDHQTEHLREIEHILNLKEDIITHYREHESVIPASPLVDEHNVPIEDLYVLPPMKAYKVLFFGQDKNKQKEDKKLENDEQDKREITVKGLFLSGDVRFRKIYITANAGFGKTSLSQKLTMTWCQSHSPLTSLTENYKGQELAAMKYFDLLFLLHLRDYQGDPKCNLDDLIMKMVSANLSRKSQYTNEFIERILHEKKCLVILDGLDEWAHPGHCTRKPEVPHNNHPDSCTVLTTTRDWKIGTVGLSQKDIDRRVEISMLDDETRNLLEKNALEILNERNLNLAGKNIADFDKEVTKVQLENIIYIPYILLQLMCLFFGGLPIGKSKFEIYSNITEFTLKRGLKKKDLPDIHVQSDDNAAVPNCLKHNKKCNLYFNLIMKLGKLAFCALFSEKKESSLIFDRKSAKKFMNKHEIEFCLKVGLLCQTKDSSIIAVKRYQVFFQHKSVQEFFSAIYVTCEWQNESVKSTILNVCSSLSGILDMSNVFVFVCGINPEVYTCISGDLQTIVDLDGVTRRCRIGRYSDDDAKTLKSYQSMQMQCLQESMRNGNASCPIGFYVILDRNEYLPVYFSTLKTVIHFNKGLVKSILVSNPNDKLTAFMQSLDPGVFTSLETLRVEHCDEELIWLADILTESARTLKCLTLSASGDVISLSDISIAALTGLTCLQSLYLYNVDMTHSNLNCLNAYISKTTTLTQLQLEWIHCSDREGQYRNCGVTLDLHRLNELMMLHLSKVDMTHSNLKCLYAFISQTTTLTQLKLVAINCSDRWVQYHECDVTLDLHRLNELKMLHLNKVPFRELRVNPACLEKLVSYPLGEKMTARACTTLWQDLSAAPVLSSLTLENFTYCKEMIQTIPTITQLQHLKLGWIDMVDVIPRVSPDMTHLERVELASVTMSSASWRGLLLSVGQMQHPVTVKLYNCRGSSRKEWRIFMDEIKSTPTFSWIQDLDLSFDDDND